MVYDFVNLLELEVSLLIPKQAWKIMLYRCTVYFKESPRKFAALWSTSVTRFPHHQHRQHSDFAEAIAASVRGGSLSRVSVERNGLSNML